MCFSQCCYSCHARVIWDRMLPSCLQNPGHQGNLSAGAEGRHLTLQEILYPAASWELEAAAGATPLRRNSPKVCPVNLDDDDDDFSASSDDDETGYSTAANESVSMVSRASVRSQHSVSRRVRFRSPDESDVSIIPARSDSDDEYSDGDRS